MIISRFQFRFNFETYKWRGQSPLQGRCPLYEKSWTCHCCTYVDLSITEAEYIYDTERTDDVSDLYVALAGIPCDTGMLLRGLRTVLPCWAHRFGKLLTLPGLLLVLQSKIKVNNYEHNSPCEQALICVIKARYVCRPDISVAANGFPRCNTNYER